MEVLVNNEQFLSFTKAYWCHICLFQFSKIHIEGNEVSCPSCHGNIIEDVSQTLQNGEEHPSKFEIFEGVKNNEEENEENNSNDETLILSESSRHLLNVISTVIERIEEAQTENIINYLMQNDPNHYGNPPTSKKILKNLHKKEVTEDIKNELNTDCLCSVCKDNYELNQIVIELPCKHSFHEECILPWLNQRNTCPTCRHELKEERFDDDIDKYIKEKRYTL